MYIEKNGAKGLYVTLSAAEVTGYFGSFEEMDGTDERTKSAIGDILQKAGFFEKEHNIGRLNVKVYPCHGGGCRIKFTEAAARSITVSRKFTGYELSNPDDAIAVCSLIMQSTGENIRASIFTLNGKYRVFIPLCIRTGIEKYCESEYFAKPLTSKNEREKTKEHWHTVCTNTPLITICNGIKVI